MAVTSCGSPGRTRSLPTLPSSSLTSSNSKLTDSLVTIAFEAFQLACVLYQGVRHPMTMCGLSLPSPLTCYSIYCPARLTTCPWPVQLAALTTDLVARYQGTLVYVFSINMTSLSLNQRKSVRIQLKKN